MTEVGLHEIQSNLHAIAVGLLHRLVPTTSNAYFREVKRKVMWRQLCEITEVAQLDDDQIKDLICNLLSNRTIFAVGEFFIMTTILPREDEVLPGEPILKTSSPPDSDYPGHYYVYQPDNNLP